MKITTFLRDLFGSKDVIYLNERLDTMCTNIAIDSFATQVAINLISSCIAKCEFKTFLNKKEIIGDEYYLWNIEPNKNQNSTEFLQELISKLLINNEVLVIQVNDELIIADDFNREEFAVKEDYFDQVSKKGFSFNKLFYMSEVLYFRHNNEDIRLYLNNLMSAYNELLSMAKGKYKRAGGRKGIVDIDSIAKGDKEKNEQLEKLFSEKFKNFFEAENAVVDLPKGVKYTEITGEGSKKSSNELNDITKLIDDAFIRIAQTFKIPPALLKGDIADVEKLTDNFLTFCIDPIVDLIQTEINRKRYGKSNFFKGSYLYVDITNIKHIDIFSIAEKIDKLIACGMYSIDDLKKKLKDTVLNTEWSEKHWITKNYQGINEIDSKGGD
ncbi:phage portal protein [Clostridium botulinum]|uniref:phage portal protein n=1 Tax=Clostridium botulinum TaxID=1491 RepID=UPI000174E5FC|nr:phage portal protein [Clostridium botulinum]ACD51729.1 phage portal protein, HK97 family [Clostridium botulinum E3 str. Alaska E43]MBY6816520.1 phage portal protein [Clostridium botulinum]MBY6827225.1 phage portal protein [Clostridium botulinum]MBY6859173.1 phage portal protein [Clostridium botulinum]MBY7041543.1 phage portal protein [Clostridium botulinum]